MSKTARCPRCLKRHRVLREWHGDPIMRCPQPGFLGKVYRCIVKHGGYKTYQAWLISTQRLTKRKKRGS